MKNLDTMNYHERLSLSLKIYNSRERMIRRLFPKDSDGADKAASLIQEYCFLSAMIIRLVEDGDIEKANKYETMANAIYAQLPDYARWK